MQVSSPFPRKTVAVWLMLLLSNCTIHTYDESTGVSHMYGIGHVAYTIQPDTEGISAIATQLDSIGIGLTETREGGTATLGFGRTTELRILQQDACIRMEWLSSSLINVRVGSDYPSELGEKPIKCPHTAPFGE